MTEPLIILGMHRSGTSMLTRILREQGVFLGHTIVSDDEAQFFVDLNRWVLRVAGTDWDYPVPAIEMLRNPDHAARIADHLSGRMSGLRTQNFLGPKLLSARARIGSHLPFLWGFKDPRTSITLPLWLKLFPNAKLLRIQRHGVDVAASLKTRQERLLTPLLGRYSRMVRMGLRDPARTHIVGSVRSAEIKGGVELWSEYEGALDHYLSEVPSERQMTLRYEDYLTDFDHMHREVADFIGIDPSVPLPPGTQPDPSRAYAFKSKEELRAAAEEHAPILARHGY